MYRPCARHWPGVLFAEYMVRTAHRWLNRFRAPPPDRLIAGAFDRLDVPA